MHTGTLTVRKVFEQERRHIAPMYQRPYVWTEDEQWEPLWNDFKALAEALLGGGQPRPHFLGAIVLDQRQTPTGHVETRMVIDGQQRLTTLQLFLEAFADLCKVRGLDPHHRALLKLTRNDDPLSKDPDEAFKVWPTNVDREHYRRIMNFGSPAEVEKYYKRQPKPKRPRKGVAKKGRTKAQQQDGHPLAGSYTYFYRVIDAWIGDAGESAETRVAHLFEAITNYVRLVVIDLDKEDDAQLIFETLNARGTPLLASDLAGR